MEDFKLLAIRPLKGCHPKFLKVLIANTVYKFYDDYTFIHEGKDENEDVIEIRFKETVPSDLYSISTKNGKKVDISINVSAILGKNGSGKSSLLELLFASIYLISTSEEILKPNFNSLQNDLLKWKKKKSKSKTVPEGYTANKSAIEQKGNEIQKLNNQLKVEIYYLIGNRIYSVRIDNTDKKSPKKFSSRVGKGLLKGDTLISFIFGEPQKISLSKLFYSIAVNYSIHGLNSLQLGNWIKDLFHKNDGYQTPIVINPYRDKGNIDMNVEMHLVQSRILTNLINKSGTKKNIIGEKSVEKIEFKIGIEKLKVFGIINLDSVINKLIRDYSTKDQLLKADDIFVRIYEIILKVKFDNALKQVPHFNSIVKYTIKKIFKIANNYEEYRKFLYIPNDGKPHIPQIKKLDKYLKLLRRDKSHITLKLKQILNIVRFNLLRINRNKDILWKKDTFTLTINEFEERINKIIKKVPTIELIEIMPVAFFNPTLFVLNNKLTPTISTATFEVLSSGEQQLIHSTQSIFYHLIYLNSVFNSGSRRKKKFRYVNIILDEIELYFHPELQQMLVDELLKGISQLKIENIKGLNILFVTHSPFILSDIPNTNILKLEDGDPKPYLVDEPTFGANVYDLLANDFYLNDGFMGEFAKSKINQVISSLRHKILTDKRNQQKTIENSDTEKIDLKFIDIELKQIKVKKQLNQYECLNLISLVGEPVLRVSLEELYSNAYP